MKIENELIPKITVWDFRQTPTFQISYQRWRLEKIEDQDGSATGCKVTQYYGTPHFKNALWEWKAPQYQNILSDILATQKTIEQPIWMIQQAIDHLTQYIEGGV